MKKYLLMFVMEKKMTQSRNHCRRFAAAMAFLALLCASFHARAQYMSFFSKGNWGYTIDYYEPACYMDEYHPEFFPFCNETFSFVFYHEDTIRIGDKIYYKEGFSYSDAYLREDTVNGRLYARYSTDLVDDEYLLCDLSLSVGDTFVLPDGSANWSSYGDRIMVVDSVGYPSGKKVIYLSSCNYNNEIFYTSTYFSPADFNISLRFMEGVGPMYGVNPAPPQYTHHLGLLLCLYKDDSLYYMTHETLGCFQSTADIPLYPESCLQVYPNPTNDQVTLEFITEEEVSGTEIIRDMVGRVCRQFSVNDKKTTLELSSLPQGAYMLTFIDQQNRKITKKIVKQ